MACGPASVLFRVSRPRGGQAALKVFRLSGTPEEQARPRASMRRDWRIWSRLAHPHALPAYDYGETRDALYVATQWVSGPSLRGVLDKRRTLDAAQIRELAEQLASALDAAAAARLIHLDVKPENVLFASADGTGHAYVTDFGAGRLAAWQAGADGSATFRGTLEYAAPEQIQGHAVDSRTVVYSLGCLLYETLTGATPYAGRSPDALLRAHLEEAPPPVEGGPAALNRVFATALAKTREERYATCTELAGALRAALAFAPAPRRPRGTPRRRRGLRHAAVAASIGAVAAGLAAAALTLGEPGPAGPARETRLGVDEFLAALPGSGPSVEAARHSPHAAPKPVATRKPARPRTQRHHVAATTRPPEANRATQAPTSPPPAPRVKHRASSPTASRGSAAVSPPPETTTPAAAPAAAPLPPPPPPADPTPPLPPPPP